MHKDVRYEQIEMIKPEHRARLLQDLRERTGLDIHLVVVQRIDFVRDIANLRAFYHENNPGTAAESQTPESHEKTTATEYAPLAKRS